VGSLTLPVAAGGSVELEAVAWTGSFTSWANAVSSGSALLGYSGETFNSSPVGALGWSQSTPVSGPPGTLVTGSSGFFGIVLLPNTNAPEPGTIALGGLGASLLFLFRRLRNR
jgi:hypothetical protein